MFQAALWAPGLPVRLETLLLIALQPGLLPLPHHSAFSSFQLLLFQISSTEDSYTLISVPESVSQATSQYPAYLPNLEHCFPGTCIYSLIILIDSFNIKYLLRMCCVPGTDQLLRVKVLTKASKGWSASWLEKFRLVKRELNEHMATGFKQLTLFSVISENACAGSLWYPCTWLRKYPNTHTTALLCQHFGSFRGWNTRNIPFPYCYNEIASHCKACMTPCPVMLPEILGSLQAHSFQVHIWLHSGCSSALFRPSHWSRWDLTNFKSSHMGLSLTIIKELKNINLGDILMKDQILAYLGCTTKCCFVLWTLLIRKGNIGISD